MPALIAIFSCALLGIIGCSMSGLPATAPGRMEPALRRVVETRPDSVIGVLIRLTRDVQDSDRDRLQQAGLSVGSARGRLVTGTLRAINALKVSRLDMVEWMELSNNMLPTIPRPPIRRNRSSR
ncbi:MAG: hypothetical protein WEE89_08130 [Gemmatimonadota bacterium]